MTSLESFIKVISSLGSEALTVSPERCIQVRNKNARCLRCAEVCAAGAISYDGEDVIIDSELCIGCGTCATACPTCALEATHPRDEELSRQLSELLETGDGIVVACARALSRARKKAEAKAEEASSLLKRTPVDFDATHIIQVVCLGRLDESFYVEAAARGARSITLACDSCETCRYKRGGALARDVAASAQGLFEAHQIDLGIDFTTPLAPRFYETGQASSYDPAKRATITTLRDMTKRAAAAGIAPSASDTSVDGSDEPGQTRFAKVNESGTLPQFVPTRRNRIVNSLRRIGTPQQDAICTRLWGRVEIDVDACMSCRMCATFCPTGAITRYDGDGEMGVEHRAYRCVQCRLCENICARGAITVHDDVSLGDFETGRVVRIPMKPPAWTPNKPDSIFRKMDALIGGGNNSYF